MKRLVLIALLILPLTIKAQDNKLDAFVALADSLRINMGIPGVGMVIVKENKVIYKGGLGYSNVETKTATTANTLFSIGSNTKAFTGVLVAKLVEENKLNWNDALKKHIPEFDLKEDYIEKNATIADALSHATGLERNDAVWKHKNIDRKQLLSVLKDLSFVANFRDSYTYNNLMYTVAGITTERVSGDTWESQIESEIFSPLGMTNSFTTFEEFTSNKNRSTGYNADGCTPIPPVDLTAVAPSGSISSTAEDMAQWLLMLVNNGLHNEAPFLTEESYNYIMSPHTKLSIRNGDELWYYYAGLGGFSKNGNRNIGHSGSIDGQNSKIVIRPDDGFGIVIMTNKVSEYKDILAQYAQELFLEGEITRQSENEYRIEAIHHSYVLETLINSSKEKEAKRYYQKLEKSRISPFLEAVMNELGYIFLRQNKVNEAILVFMLNTEGNPNSSNAFDSLGEALLKADKKIEGIKAYKKSLELDPTNDNAKKVLSTMQKR